MISALSHLSLGPHICVGELGTIGLVNGLAPARRRQAITWINNWTLGNKFRWYLNDNSIIFIQKLKMCYAKMAASLFREDKLNLFVKRISRSMHALCALFCSFWCRVGLFYLHSCGVPCQHRGTHKLALLPMNQPWRNWVIWRQDYIKNWWHKHNKSKHNKTVRTFYDMYDHSIFSVPVISVFPAWVRDTIFSEVTGISRKLLSWHDT